jgi:hypothetical protein
MASSPLEIEGTWEEILARASELKGRRLKVTVLPAENEAGKPIEEVIEALAAQVPPEAWENLPEDLSDDLDHYIYGTPRR